jgi:hypothetical protein
MFAALRAQGRSPLAVRATIACSVVAGPLFVSGFTALGVRRAGYDWRRHAVSSLTDGRQGRGQRVNFVLVGGLYCTGAAGLARSPRRTIGPRVVPALIFGAGVGLMGSGLFVTHPVAGFPPSAPNPNSVDGPPPRAPATCAGTLHNLCAIPIFIGIPVAALTCAVSAARRRPRTCEDRSSSRRVVATSVGRTRPSTRGCRRSLPNGGPEPFSL